MRVSKLVKDYITKEVGKKFETAVKSLQEIWEKQEEACCAELDELLAEMNEKGNAILAKYPELVIPYLSPEVFCRRRVDYNHTAELYQKMVDLDTKKKQAIDNILVSLELEGTKANLEKMLNEIEVDC